MSTSFTTYELGMIKDAQLVIEVMNLSSERTKFSRVVNGLYAAANRLERDCTYTGETLTAKNSEIATLTAQINRLNAELNEKDDRIQRLKTKIEEQADEIIEAKFAVSEAKQKDKVADLNLKMANLNIKIADLNLKIASLEDQVRYDDEYKKVLWSIMADRNKKIEEQDLLIHQKQIAIDLLEMSDKLRPAVEP